MTYVWTVTGFAIAAAALLDIYLTVLYARSATGLMAPHVYRLVWTLFRRASSRGSVLSYAGPTMLVCTVALWLLLLATGFALIMWPHVGTAITADSGPTSPKFSTALYVSGFSLTTLGVGDLAAHTAPLRLLMVFEAATGFSVLTLTLTYFLSIYSSLVRRNTFALALHHGAGRKADAAALVAGMMPGGDMGDVRRNLDEMAHNLMDLFESGHSYPVVHYFRLPRVEYAPVRVCFLCMDTASLLHAALDRARCAGVLESGAWARLWGGGTGFLSEMDRDFLPRRRHHATRGPESIDRVPVHDRFHAAWQRLRDGGVPVDPDAEACAVRYQALRTQWEPPLRRYAAYMAYAWREIDPAAGCRDGLR